MANLGRTLETRSPPWAAGLACCLLLSACRSEELPPPWTTESGEVPCDKSLKEGDLLFNELVAKNEGVWVDESGATDDFIELVNRSDREIDLSHLAIEENSGIHSLPARRIAAGERVLLWADGQPDEGPLHLPFKLSSEGEHMLMRTCDLIVDELTYPALGENDSYSRHPDAEGAATICRYATPDAENGDDCVPPLVKGLAPTVVFDDYQWPSAHPPLPQPLVLSELALNPASFIEIENTGTNPIELSTLALTIAPLYPGQELPESNAGELISLGEGEIAPGERLSVPVDDEQVAALASDPLFEGVVSIFDETGEALDRIDFMHWPEGATLTRPLGYPELAVFCEETTPGAENTCTMLEERDVGDRVRSLRTHSDFAALSAGGTELSTESVKVVVDVVQGNRTHLLSALRWPLHYTFVREVIEQEPPLDRCDPSENLEFNQGWYDFSVTEYFSTVGRSYFLATLVKHGATGDKTVEFTPGDEILGEDMRNSFFTIVGHTLAPQDWFLRPQDDTQVQKILPFDGQLPLLATNAPFSDLTYQPLTQGEGFGVLTFVTASELSTTPLGSQTILVTDDVPNDIPLTGGLITQAFQTPLAHVNVLSQNRGTPNMALRDVLEDVRISSNLGKMVRLDVRGNDFQIEEAAPEEAQAFWDARRPTGDLQVPRLDGSVRDFVDLTEASLDSIPIIGAKASQMGELYKVTDVAPSLCAGKPVFSPPKRAFAVPVVHFLEHFEASGAQELLETLASSDEFRTNPIRRADDLAQVRELISQYPVQAKLLTDLESEIRNRFGSARVRFRSSSNAEDLPGFNGAGLYQSTSAELDNEERTIADALRLVWASLMSARAYDERELALIDHSAVAMGVLVHEAFPEELANGVGVSRNVLDPIRGDIYYLNAQLGEASVTNPAPGVLTEELTFQWPPRTPRLNYQSYSTLSRGSPVLSEEEVDSVACALFNVHQHFLPLLDPDGDDPWFAMEIEFKLIGDGRELLLKQARPHAFSGYEVVGDCREF